MNPRPPDRHQPVRQRRRWLFIGLYPLFLILLAVLGGRLYLWLAFGIEPRDLSNQVDADALYYPELFSRRVFTPESEDSSVTRLLFLGGSVVEQLEAGFESVFESESGADVWFGNGGASAHTTLDSVHKMRAITDAHVSYDVLLVYHGINDARMNCIAPDLFRDDYQHCAWYRAYAHTKSTGKVRLSTRVGDAIGQLIARGEPEPEMVGFGRDIKTAGPFRGHLEEVISLARAAGMRVVLMTFATHFVDGYSREAFESRSLGYAAGGHELPTEIWGRSENVRLAVNTHNRVVRELAAQHNLPLIDMEAELTDIAYFSDVCHLSKQGVRRFSEVVADHARQHGWLN